MGREFEGTENTAASDFYISPFTSEVSQNTLLLMETTVTPSKEGIFLTIMAFSLAHFTEFLS